MFLIFNLFYPCKLFIKTLFHANKVIQLQHKSSTSYKTQFVYVGYSHTGLLLIIQTFYYKDCILPIVDFTCAFPIQECLLTMVGTAYHVGQYTSII